MALLSALGLMTRKPAPFAMLDTHAGIGRYDLTSDAARRSPEWRDGIGRLRNVDNAPTALRALLDAAPDEHAYPGSPALALQAMRAQDRYVACELHPEDAATLRALIGEDARAHVHQRDGYEAAGALTPFPEQRGLVLIDPPYEADDDIARSVETIRMIARRFRQCVILWWRPLKVVSHVAAADRELGVLGLEMARFDLAISAPGAGKGLRASSILALNPPFGLSEDMRDALEFVAPRLAQGDGAAYSPTPALL
jgi:23S rRNA (adenine2030-N6)-methyltransferase